MPKTILVTGSAGFIGFHLSKALLDRGDRVIGVDNFNTYYDPALKEARNKILESYKDYKLYRVDITDQKALNDIFARSSPPLTPGSPETAKHFWGGTLGGIQGGFDVIFHLAAQAGVRYSLEHPGEYVQTNIAGTVNIFESARTHNLKNIIFVSSSSVYGNNPVPWSETQEVNQPINPYGASKRASELLAYTYHHLYGFNMTILRFFSVYGPWGRPDMAYFKFADKIVKNEPIDVYNNGKLKRDFTYIDDIIEGALAAIDNPKAYEIYNLGNSHPEELGKFIQLIEKNLGKEAKKNYLPLQPGDFLENFADTAKAKKDLGFEPKVSIEEGIKKFVEWYKEYYRVT